MDENMRDKCEYPPPFTCLKHLQAMDSSFVTITKFSNNKIRETFCEGLK